MRNELGKKIKDSTIEDLVNCGYEETAQEILQHKEGFTWGEARSYIKSIKTQSQRL